MNRNEKIIIELTEWIDNNLTGNLKIEEVAKKSGYSKWHLQRMFQCTMNITLAHYIRDKRLALAALDLSGSNESVLDISLKYGYDSQQAFTRSFSKKYNIPPATWRRLNFQ
ncbi:helix-turn-helix domain-containing protein [Pantoea cypripedii]|uniref:DNA-binding transcriptional regulator RamA n=1 Tax=Pantoea cypripedii TaxID=55209 RepID=A0A6B9G983_PANCY|nr:helix-turn-helix domain-containing protein [Pantoea cypripedii]QGY32413.1 DNA-binding transcriptional regulator RamA [Pantoea cypripedii]